MQKRQTSFLSKIQNRISEKTGKKILLLYGKIQGSGFSFQSLNQNIKVVIHYLKNKVGVVDFANAQGLVMFSTPKNCVLTNFLP